jgi:aminopeptidase N
MKKCLSGLLILSLATACNEKPAQKSASGASAVPARDLHTLSNADSVLPKHLALDLAVNFEQRQLTGSATWDIENRGAANEFIIDSRGLQIDSARADAQPVTAYKSAAVEGIGEALHLPIQKNTSRVTIYYRTGADASALQWLTPQQTDAKTAPFLYTQSEPTHARSWIPCPDGPGIRFTYDARIKVPKGLLALMSAENPQTVNDSGVYQFRMDRPIPAYLVALAVGDLRFRAVDNRTGVYAEPSVIDRAAKELEDMGTMVKTAEGLYGPYRWGRYDVLILPPGFPIGGMENPKLTFATPTILAGDKSLVNLISHELAHNWSGNLVTNATWDDIWMNEGFTVYFERRITEAMMGKSYVDMLWELGYQDLEKEVSDMGATNRTTWLKQDLRGKDPDEGLSDIPYEKGSLFLWLVERTVGRPRFDQFLKDYFAGHAFKTITTEQFLAELHQKLSDMDSSLEKKVNVQAWVYGPGIPSNAPHADRERFAKVDAGRTSFMQGTNPATLQTGSWTTHEWLHFLRGLPDSMSLANMTALDNAFHFTQTGNSEIADLWFEKAIKARYQPAYPAMEKFLSRVGRQKFLGPLYEAMVSHGQQGLAKKLFERYKANYHPIAQQRMAKTVNGNK